MAAGGSGTGSGFLRRGLSWAGLASAARRRRAAGRRPRRRAPVVAAAHAPARVARRSSSWSPRSGRRVGVRDRRSLLAPAPRPRRRLRCARATASRAARSASSACSSLMWLLIPALASSPGWPARAVRDSRRWRAPIDRVRARAPRRSRRRSAASSATSRSPRCSTRSRHPTPGTPPADGIPAEAAARVAASVVKVEGIRPATGSRRAPASSPRRDLVVTNAHVVAGERAHRGRRRATAAASTRPSSRSIPNRDLAVLRVPGLALPALELRDGRGRRAGLAVRPPRWGTAAAGAGAHRRADRRPWHRHHPHQPDRARGVRARGGHRTGRLGRSGRRRRRPCARRDVRLDISRPTTAYALTDDELDAVLDPVLAGTTPAPNGTGACLAE